MAVYSAREIYRFAVLAGFTPDQAVTMTAIALAESGGESGAHNSSGEDSRGLWQINVDAHRTMAGRDLTDPLENARAAYEVSHGGRDVSPWTTTHGLGDAKYLAFRAEAQAAAAETGSGRSLGMWAGTEGYGHPAGASDGGGFGQSGVRTGAAESFVQAALSQTGDSYRFGAEATSSDPDPTTFDCSELTQWAAAQAGVDLPDGSWQQYLALQDEGSSISVDEALRTRGALLFSFSSPPSETGGRPGQAHVAISLGDGRTIEARGTQYGVGTWSGENRFNYAAVVPGLADGGLPRTQPADAAVLAAVGPAVDSDRDGLIDALELQIGTDPSRADTDLDGTSDGYEIAVAGTDATTGDSDRDGLLDSIERVLGTDPTSPDSDRDGRLDGVVGDGDRDVDGLSDSLERLLGTNPYSLDSDRDGFSDGIEYAGRTGGADPASTPLTSSPGGTVAGSAALDRDAPGTADDWGSPGGGPDDVHPS